MPYIITNGCHQCGTCIYGCEAGAISEEPERNKIDFVICIECGICADNCPFEAIVFEEEAKSVS